MLSRSLRRACLLYKQLKQPSRTTPQINYFHLTPRFFQEESEKRETDEKMEIMKRGGFEEVEDKNRNTYLEMIRIYINRDSVHRRGHVEFIYSALKNMENFGVHKDLEVYKALIDVLPKGKFIAQNMMQVEFMHYPKQQQCIIDLLEQMEDNGVMPDYEIQEMLMNIFGNKTFPLRKYWRMMYWMPKFKNLTPWPLPDPLPDGIYELARLAIERITTVDPNTEISTYQTKDIDDSIEDTWIISAQSPAQKTLLENYDKKLPVYVEGPFKVWLRKEPVNYFILRGKPKTVVENNVYEDPDDVSNIEVSHFNFTPPVKKDLSFVRSVHEQDDGIIFSVCATGLSSKDSLLSWIRHLEKTNPVLSELNVVFTLRTGSREIALADDQKTEQIEGKKDDKS